MKKLMFVFIFVFLLTGMRACSWLPSDFFRGLDSDGDQSLHYREWMAYYTTAIHDHSIEQCSRRDFYHADCNLDDNLSWEEYYNFRFKHNTCEHPSVMTIRQKIIADPDYLSADKPSSALSRLGVPQQHIEELLQREKELMEKYQLRNKSG